MERLIRSSEHNNTEGMGQPPVTQPDQSLILSDWISSLNACFALNHLPI